jgi:hypothetical protein
MAIGGFDGTSYLKSVEIFDAESNTWKINSSMIYRRLGGGVGTIKLQKDSVLYNLTPNILNNTTNNHSSHSPLTTCKFKRVIFGLILIVFFLVQLFLVYPSLFII